MDQQQDRTALPKRVKRHRLSTRIWHWINALTVLVMLMSGLMIFNAHPRLYWGEYGANADRAWLEIGSTERERLSQAGSARIPTTGVLGRWTDPQGNVQRRAFPRWATIPSAYSLAAARRWHLAFAWMLALGLLAFVVASLLNRHVQRDLRRAAPNGDRAACGTTSRTHARLRFPPARRRCATTSSRSSPISA